MTDPTIIGAAIGYHAAGLTPIPVAPDGTKRPLINTWTQWQDTQPDLQQAVSWFAHVDSDGLGILTGGPNHREVMEFEGRAITEGALERYAAAAEAAGLGELWGRVRAGYVAESPSCGQHNHLIVSGECRRNTKLAERPSTPEELEAWKEGERVKLPSIADEQLRAKRAERIDVVTADQVRQVLIETRGQGGFIVMPPSAGRTHSTGRGWVVLAGKPQDAAVVTPAERDALYDLARTLDQMPAPTAPAPRPEGRTHAPAGDAPGGRPGDDYNERANWDDILIPHGWTKAGRRGSETLWTRPGKDTRDGISATTGYADDADRLFVFTSSTEFEPEQPYSKFSALATLEHGGDHAACARRLASDGWGGGPAEQGPALTLAPAAAAPESDAGGDEITPEVTPDRGATILAFPGPGQHDTSGANALAPAPADIALARYGQTEDGLSRALVDHHGHQLRYCPQRSSWLVWTGTRWAWDESGRHRELIKEVARSLPDNEAWKQHRKRMLSSRGIDGVAKMAATIASTIVDAGDLDADPWILNTASGVVNLRTGAVRPATPEDLCTRTTGVPYDPDAQAPRWERFLEETFSGDAEMIGYVQRLLGYSACGAVTHHILPFAHGGGQNGKSVFLSVALGVLGEYASSTPNRFLMAGKDDESAIARLSGLRLVVASEVNERDRFDEARVKLLTGGDRLTSRFLYGNYFTFTPTHHLWLMGNHQPRVEAGGDSFWRRLRLLPFTHRVPDDRKIPDLEKILVSEEAPGILAWIVRGAMDALSNDDLRDPDGVRAATAAYAEEEDALARFFADRIMLTAAGREGTSEVRGAYLQWCRAEGEQETSPQSFGRELRARWGITQTKSNGKKFYAGMTLLSDSTEPDDDDRTLTWDQR